MNYSKAPLGQAEIELAANIVRRKGGLNQQAWFETISLDESDQFPADQRCAYVCSYEPSSNRTFSGIAVLEEERLHDWKHIEGAQARIVPDEFVMAWEIAREDVEFIKALKKRGIDDPQKYSSKAGRQVILETRKSNKHESPMGTVG